MKPGVLCVVGVLAAPVTLTSCTSHSAHQPTEPIPRVRYIRPEVARAKVAAINYLSRRTRGRAVRQVECRRFGKLALNCFVFGRSTCRVVGVRETSRHRVIAGPSFGVVLCAASSSR
jgi:hypothetical protein